MAISKWGPMRLFEIEQLAGKVMPSVATSRAAAHLEKLGIVVRQYRGQKNITVALDRRHPAYKEIRSFGLRMYKAYIAPLGTETPKARRQPLTPCKPKHRIDAAEMHVLGSKPIMRCLHLLAEIRSCPAFVLGRWQGVVKNLHGLLHKLNVFGLVRRRNKGVDVYYRLNAAWQAHGALRNLLKALNRHMPEYAAVAAEYRIERRRGHYSSKFRYGKKARIRAAAAMAANSRRELRTIKERKPVNKAIKERRTANKPNKERNKRKNE